MDGQFLDLNDRLYAGSIDKDGHKVGHKEFEQKAAATQPREVDNAYLNYNPNAADEDLIIAALAVINADCGWRGWYKIACAVRFELGDDGEEVFHNFSSRSARYDKAQCDKKWSEAEGNPLHRAGTIFYLATLANPIWRDEYNASRAPPHIDDDDGDGDNAADDDAAAEYRAPTFSEEALALTFAERHESNLRYVAKWGSWMQWDGTRWGFDETLRAFSLSRAICREASSTCNNSKAGMAIASAKTVAAIERLAKADRVLAATVDQWDTAPFKFNEGD